MRLKILHVASLESFLLNFMLPFLRQLVECQADVHVAANMDRDQSIAEKGIVAHDISFRRSPLDFNNMLAFHQIIRLLRRERYDLVHVHTPVASVLTRLACVIVGVPCVVYTAHGFHFFSGAGLLNWVLYYPVERVCARFTDCLVTINEEDYRRAKDFCLRSNGTLVKLNGVGVKSDRYRKVGIPARTRGGHSNPLTVITIGELSHRKNHIQLIRAMKLVANAQPNARLLVVGEGPLRRRLTAEVFNLGLSVNVEFLGFRTDIAELLAVSDIVVSTSRQEGLPKALLEGMAAGKPLVATDIRGHRDLVSNGVNGYLVPPEDIVATSQRIIALLGNERRRIEYGRRNTERVIRYEEGLIVSSLLEVYSRFLPSLRSSVEKRTNHRADSRKEKIHLM